MKKEESELVYRHIDEWIATNPRKVCSKKNGKLVLLSKCQEVVRAYTADKLRCAVRRRRHACGEGVIQPQKRKKSLGGAQKKVGDPSSLQLRHAYNTKHNPAHNLVNNPKHRKP